MVCHAVRINGLTELVITKLDILSGLKKLLVCVAYELDGKRIDTYPSELTTLARCQPIYEALAGWQEDITHARHMEDLPDSARHYIKFIATKTGIPVTYVSVGPGREQVIQV
jgi:adenylosuccinate synthase